MREKSENGQKGEKEKKSPWLKRIIFKINDILDMAFFFKLSKAMELKAVIGTMVSLKSAQFQSTADQINFSVGVVVLFFYVCLTLSVTYLLYYKHNLLNYPWERSWDKEWEGYIEDLKLYSELKEVDKTTTKGTFIVSWTMLHDLLVPLILVGFINSPYVQILSIIFLIWMVLYPMISYRPYKQKQKNASEIVNKVLFFLILVVFGQ